MSSRNAPRWPRRASATSSASGRVDQGTAPVVARAGMESSCVTNRRQQRGKGSRWPFRPSVEPGQVARLGYRSAVLWLFARRGFRRLRRRHLPAAGLAFVLLLEPFLQRREVLEHRRAVDLLATGELLHRLLPRLARALVQHRPELLTGTLVDIGRAHVCTPVTNETL